MSAEANKAVERRLIEEMWNRGNLDVADELCAADVIIHNYPVSAPGAEGLKQAIATVLAGFPDAQMTIEDLFAEADRVAVRWTFRGTHQHEFLGLAPTGRQVTLSGMSIDRFADGKVVERWVETNLDSMMQQLSTNATPGAL